MNVESFPEPTRYGLSDRYTYSIYGLQYYTGLQLQFCVSREF